MCAHTHTHKSTTLLPHSALAFIYVSSQKGYLDSSQCPSGQLLLQPLTHVQTCPLSPPVYLPLLIKDSHSVSFFLFFLLLPPFHPPPKSTVLVFKFSRPCVSVLVQENLCN